MSKKSRKTSNRPRQGGSASGRPSAGWTPEQLAAVGPPAGQPGYVEPGDLRRWLAEFDARHQRLPAAGRVPAQPGSPPQLPPAAIPGLDRLGEITEHLTHTLEWLQATHAVIGHDVDDPDALFDTASLRDSMMNLFDHVQAHLETLQAALGVVVRAEPLATTHRNGSRWAGKLAPVEVLRLAEAATGAGGISYLAGRADQVLAEATSLGCDGGPSGKHCGGTRVRLADGTRAPSCWAHLNAEQKAAIRAERDAALQQPCPFCQSPAATPASIKTVKTSRSTATGYATAPTGRRTRRVDHDRVRPAQVKACFGRSPLA